MAKWNVSVGLDLTIDYDDIEVDAEEEAIQIAKDRALEDIEWNNCDCDVPFGVFFFYGEMQSRRAEGKMGNGLL